MGLRSYLQASATVTKPIVIYLGQTLKPKPQRKIFEEKEPRPKVSQGRHSFFLPTFGFSFFYYLTWKGCFNEKKVKLLNKTTTFIDDIISQIVNVSLLS